MTILFGIVIASLISGVIVGINTTWYFGFSAFFFTQVVLMLIVISLFSLVTNRTNSKER